MVPATVWYASVITFRALRNSDDPKIEDNMRAWGQRWLTMSGSHLTVSGLEGLDTDRAYVIVSNHLSAYDVFSHFVALPIPIRYLAKTELFRIPVFGSALRATGMVEVNRSAHGGGLHQINAAAAAATDAKRSIMVYAEGTRSRDGVMRPFKKGAFRIAVSLRLPILPVAVTGSREVWTPGTLRIAPGNVHVHAFAPIETKDCTSADVDALCDRTRQMIYEHVADRSVSEP